MGFQVAFLSIDQEFAIRHRVLSNQRVACFNKTVGGSALSSVSYSEKNYSSNIIQALVCGL